MAFDPIPIIDIPGIGTLSAPTLVEKLKIKSQNDKHLLGVAKDECYTKGFATGIMVVGDHKGKPVSEAKTLIRDQLLAVCASS